MKAKDLAPAILFIVLACIGAMLGPEGVSFSVSDMELRSLRLITGALSGAALAMCGLVLQLVLRNPIADPYIIGVSGGAAVGGAITLAFLPFQIWAIQASAALGALVSTLILLATLRNNEANSTQRVLIAGILINAVASALITVMKTVVSATTAQSLIFWLVGHVGYPPAGAIITLFIGVGIGAFILYGRAAEIEILAFGRNEAVRLGIDTASLERRILLAVSLMVGAIAPLCGLVGFVGLIVPHMVRRLFAHRRLQTQLLASMLIGASVMTFADGLSRALFAILGTELPVGALLALVGAPMMGIILLQRPKENR